MDAEVGAEEETETGTEVETGAGDLTLDSDRIAEARFTASGTGGFDLASDDLDGLASSRRSCTEVADVEDDDGGDGDGRRSMTVAAGGKVVVTLARKSIF